MNDKVIKSGYYLQGKLREVAARHPDFIKEVRGAGLLIGVEINGERDGHELSERMQQTEILHFF